MWMVELQDLPRWEQFSIVQSMSKFIIRRLFLGWMYRLFYDSMLNPRCCVLESNRRLETQPTKVMIGYDAVWSLAGHASRSGHGTASYLKTWKNQEFMVVGMCGTCTNWWQASHPLHPECMKGLTLNNEQTLRMIVIAIMHGWNLKASHLQDSAL